jgi:hypothetical protein
VDRLVVANMVLSDEASARDAGLVRQRQDALMSRLRAEPGVTAVTFSSSVPGLGPDRRIEFGPSTTPRDAGALDVATFRIDVELMGVYGVRMLAGRGFDATDIGAGRAAIVNRTFVSDLLAPSSGALGTRFRYAAAGDGGAPASDWYEIVGVVEDFPGLPRVPGAGGQSTVYHPIAPGTRAPCRAVDPIRRHGSAGCRRPTAGAAVMAAVASLAAIGPARRILRIQTVEALRVDG